MLITREMDYAIRAVRALADGEKHNIKEICSMEDIPTEFGYKVLKKLSHSEIVTVIRGQGGGYRLLCDLNETTLLEHCPGNRRQPAAQRVPGRGLCLYQQQRGKGLHRPQRTLSHSKCLDCRIKGQYPGPDPGHVMVKGLSSRSRLPGAAFSLFPRHRFQKKGPGAQWRRAPFVCRTSPYAVCSNWALYMVL